MKTQAATQYLEERYEAGHRSYYDLTQEERETAAGHIIAGEGAMEASEVMSEGDNDTLGAMFGRYLASQSRGDSEKFLAAFRSDVSKRYENRIEELFEQIDAEVRIDATYNPPYDKDDAYYAMAA